MNILAWNSRGAASRNFPNRIRDILKGNDIDVLILCETRVSGSKADSIIRKLGFSNWMRVEATGFAGGFGFSGMMTLFLLTTSPPPPKLFMSEVVIDSMLRPSSFLAFMRSLLQISVLVCGRS